MVISSLLIICASLCGCGNDTPRSIALQTVFCCDFTAQYNDTELCGNIVFDENGAKITLSKPQTLSGAFLEMKNGEEKISLNINGLTIEFDENRYPSAAFMRIFCKAIASGGSGLQLDDEHKTLSGSIDGVGFGFTVDDSGRPQTLVIPDYSLEMSFLNYK